MIRFTLILLATLSFQIAHADDLKKENIAIPSTDVDTNEKVVVEHDLGTHMGWESQDAVFKSVRNFRQSELNEISPDMLDGDVNADN